MQAGPSGMCNLYSAKADQTAQMSRAAASRDEAGNLPPFPNIVPGRMVPVVRKRIGENELPTMRWDFLPPNVDGAPVTTLQPNDVVKPIHSKTLLATKAKI